jgi:hypothetical protein
MTESRTEEIFSTSIYNYKKTLADNIFDSYPLFDFIERGGNEARVMEDNANDIIIPLMYAANATVKSYSGYDLIDITPQAGFGNAKFGMKQVGGAVTIDRFSERQNASRAQIINLFKSKMKQLEMSFIDIVNAMLFADGTGNDSKDITGLLALVDPSPTTGTVGGFDASTNSWWRNIQASGAKTTTGYDNLVSKMSTMYNTTSHGKKDHVDLILTDQTTYEGYESLMTNTINFNVGQANLRKADLGWENFSYKGASIMYDHDCTAGYMYFLNTNYFGLHADKETYFEPMPFQRAGNQDARTGLVLLYAEMTISNRSRQGVLTACT